VNHLKRKRQQTPAALFFLVDAKKSFPLAPKISCLILMDYQLLSGWPFGWFYRLAGYGILQKTRCRLFISEILISNNQIVKQVK